MPRIDETHNISSNVAAQLDDIVNLVGDRTNIEQTVSKETNRTMWFNVRSN
jgi:hypothetical protein